MVMGLGSLGLLACGKGADTRTSIADASAQVALAAATITGQEALVANEVTANASYLGFDTGRYPGDNAMRAWRSASRPTSARGRSGAR